MVAAVDGNSGDGGTYDRGAQREKVYPGVCDREHGGTQAGRVQLYAHLQGTLHEGGDGSGGQAGGYPGRSWSSGASGSGDSSTTEGVVSYEPRATSCEKN